MEGEKEGQCGRERGRRADEARVNAWKYGNRGTPSAGALRGHVSLENSHDASGTKACCQ